MQKRTAFIVGASGEIGLAITEELLKENYQLILHYHTNDQQLKKLFQQANGQILSLLQANLTNIASIDRMLKEVVFPVDTLIFASGDTHYGLFQELSTNVMDQMLTLHVKAPLIITQHFLPTMIQNQKGKIILITSLWGQVGASHEVMYSTVKGAQNSFVRALAKEVAASGINVNGVSPGFIETKMNQSFTADERDHLLSEIPANRFGTPRDVAKTIKFLCGEESDYIHGEILRVDGAWY